jgi:hypothetical protein
MQRREIRKLQRQGIKAEVAYSVEDAQWQLQSRM